MSTQAPQSKHTHTHSCTIHANTHKGGGGWGWLVGVVSLSLGGRYVDPGAPQDEGVVCGLRSLRVV